MGPDSAWREAGTYRAGGAAQHTFHGEDWAKMSASDSGHLPRKLGDLIATNGEALARTAVIDDGRHGTRLYCYWHKSWPQRWQRGVE